MKPKKTPQKMQTYLSKLDALGMSQVRVLVPKGSESVMLSMAEEIRMKYLKEIVKKADDNDPRLEELAKSNLATRVKPEQIIEWRNSLTESQHILFDRKVLTMQDYWSNMIMAVQAKNSALMRGDGVEARRQSAEAVLAAFAYRAARDDLARYVNAAVAA